MPATSGASHAGAAFVTILLGATIKSLLGSHTDLINDLSESIGSTIGSTVGASVPEELAGVLVISTVLAFLWGIAYHHARHSTDDSVDRRNNYQSHGPSMSIGATMEAATAAVDGEHAYGTFEQAKQTDTRLRGSLARELENATSRLTDLHDRLYDADDRDRAEHASALRDHLSTVTRDIDTHVELDGTRESTEPSTTAVSIATQGGLQATHTALEEAVETVTDEVQAAHSEGTMSEQHRQECQQLLRDIERTLDERKRLLQTIGETR